MARDLPLRAAGLGGQGQALGRLWGHQEGPELLVVSTLL